MDVLDPLNQSLVQHLRLIAKQQLGFERGSLSLCASDLVNEAWIVLHRQRNLNPKEKPRFLAAGAIAIRRILIDYARKKAALKRGGKNKKIMLRSYDGAYAIEDRVREIDILALDEALEKLSKINERACQVVVQRFFGGMHNEEIARELNISQRAVVSDWTFARSWLSRELSK
ncbi:MAG: ECF-type sigma factor [Planctomycetota bacterium]